MEPRYENFDLRVERTSRAGIYRASARSSAGEESSTLELSAEKLCRLAPPLGGLRAPRRRHLLPPGEPSDTAKLFGSTLFDLAFRDLRSNFYLSLQNARWRHRGLRLRLGLAAVPELAELPWELLYDPREEGFLALNPDITVVRYLEIPRGAESLSMTPPLRVLIAAATPTDREPLEARRECTAIREALAGLEAAGRVEVEWMPGVAVRTLRERLESAPCHVLHFIGHGLYERETASGALVLEDGAGLAFPLDDERLRVLLQHADLRLVVLNTCEGGRGSAERPFAGVARSLVRQGVPAVVAMRAEVGDRAAVRLAEELYSGLARGRGVDEALDGARLTLFTEGHTSEWAIPVLYMRSPDGRLFDLPPPRRRPPLPATPLLLIAGLLVLVAAGLWLSGAPAPPARPVSEDLEQADLGRSARPAPSAVPPPDDPRCPPPPGLEELRFAYIGPGTFWMGSDDGDADERPAHQVTLTQPFCLGVFEVTEGQWWKVMEREGMAPAGPPENGRLPIVNVTRRQAWKFVALLNARVPGADPFHLPTEAQWEYACRAGSRTAYGFGDDPARLPFYGNCDQQPDGYDDRAPVGSYEANPWGLFDMHGNVAEWVEDVYGGYSPEPVMDPASAVPEGGTAKPVRRGGSWFLIPERCRCASRDSFNPDSHRKDIGFRLAREPVTPPSAAGGGGV